MTRLSCQRWNVDGQMLRPARRPTPRRKGPLAGSVRRIGGGASAPLCDVMVTFFSSVMQLVLRFIACFISFVIAPLGVETVQPLRQPSTKMSPFTTIILSPSPPSTPRNTSAVSRLRSSTPLPRPSLRTKIFESFMNFALNKYQLTHQRSHQSVTAALWCRSNQSP